MATDRAILKEVQIGHVGSTPISDPITAVKQSHRRQYKWDKAAIDTNAADNTAEFPVVHLKRACRLVAATYTALANVASASSNYIQLTVSARTAADPANATVIANVITNAAPLVAWTPYAITAVANATDVASDTVLTFKVLKASAGTKLDQGVLTIDVEEI